MALDLNFEGRSAYRPDAFVGANRLTLGIAIRFARKPNPFTALLDTGARYTVMRGETLRELDLEPAKDDEEMEISTRLGPVKGRLVRRQLVLVADEGDDLTVDAVILVSDEWLGPPVIGWTGFLESLRTGLDPATESFHFAAA